MKTRLTVSQIPPNYEVRPLTPTDVCTTRATCGCCGLSWDDGKPTSMTPAPSGRCPFEAFHLYPEDEKSEKPVVQKVIFRASRRKTPEVCAVLVGQAASFQNPLTVWDSQSGHGSGSWEWYYSTRPATPAEYADELKHLQRQYAPEYTIVPVRRYTAQDRAELHRSFYPSLRKPILPATQS